MYFQCLYALMYTNIKVYNWHTINWLSVGKRIWTARYSFAAVSKRFPVQIVEGTGLACDGHRKLAS